MTLVNVLPYSPLTPVLLVQGLWVMKFERWQNETTGKRTFSPSVAVVVGFAAGALASELVRAAFGIRDDEMIFALTCLVVMVWSGTRQMADGKSGDRLTGIALLGSLGVLGSLIAYHRCL